MPATVIVGLQWGDEGKGKTTDFLAEDVSAVVRYQGGDNAGHTDHARRGGLQAPPRPVGRALPAHRADHRQRRRRQPGHADRRAGHARQRAASRSIAVRVSKHAHVIMPYHVALDGAMEARLAQRRGRDHAPGHRARLRRPRLADRHPDGGPARRRGASRQARPASCRRRTPRCQRQHRVDGFDLDDLVEQATELGPAPARLTWPTRPSWSRTRWRAASTSCSRAPRGRCSTSTTAATRS